MQNLEATIALYTQAGASLSELVKIILKSQILSHSAWFSFDSCFPLTKQLLRSNDVSDKTQMSKVRTYDIQNIATGVC